MIPLPKLRPRNVDMSSEAIDLRLREVSDLHDLCMSLKSAKRLGTVAEVRERDRLEEEARQRGLLSIADSNQTVSAQSETPQQETAS